MTISGGIKFFKQSAALFAKGATAVASTNTDIAKFILSNNRFVRWTSSGSDDTITETITIEFASETIDRIFLIDMNFKEFTVKYDVTGTPTDFTNVVGLDGSQSVIAETDYARDTAYYEVDPVTTTKIYITATKTQIVDQEKALERFFATSEIGTFTGYPVVTEAFDNNLIQSKTLSGNLKVQKRQEVFSTKLSFKNYTPIQNDYDIIQAIHDDVNPVLVWLGGGRAGEPFFLMERKGWLLKNVYNVHASAKLDAKWNKNLYIRGFSAKITLKQATDI